MKKRVFVIGRSLEIGGVEKALVGLLNSFDYSEYEVDLQLSILSGELIPDLSKNVNMLPQQSFFDWVTLRKDKIFNSIRLLINKPRLLFLYLKNIAFGLVTHRMAEARQRMWADTIDFIPCNSVHYDLALDFSGLFRYYTLEKVNSKEKYTWIHSDYRVFGLNPSYDEPLLSRFDRICCVSKTCKLIFDDSFPGISDKSFVVPNIIDRSLIEKRAIEGASFNDGFDGIRLLDVTRIDPNKGLDIAVDVCAELVNRGVNFRWYILGNDPLGYRKTLEHIIEDKKVGDYFRLLGFSSNPYSYMKDSDIIVHFSRFEGRSVAIDEAMALCKPILLTNYPTARDQISSGVTGIISEFEIDELVSNLMLLINSEETRDYYRDNLSSLNHKTISF